MFLVNVTFSIYFLLAYVVIKIYITILIILYTGEYFRIY